MSIPLWSLSLATEEQWGHSTGTHLHVWAPGHRLLAASPCWASWAPQPLCFPQRTLKHVFREAGGRTGAGGEAVTGTPRAL